MGTPPIYSESYLAYPFPLEPLDRGSPISTEANPDILLGKATSLWPILHSLAQLHKVKDKMHAAGSCIKCSADATLTGRTNSCDRQPMTCGNSCAVAMCMELHESAARIEHALLCWQLDSQSDERSPAHHRETTPSAASRREAGGVLDIAQAYRHSALVYLYRTFLNYPRSHELVQHHTSQSLGHCVAAALEPGTLGTLLWPLFTAAVNAGSIDERQLAEMSFSELATRQGMANITQAWCVVQETWARIDLQEASFDEHVSQSAADEDDWRTIAAEKGLTLVLA